MTTATVNETDAGARLDVYAGALLGISRAGAQKLIECGAVRVNGRPAPKNRRLEPGDVVEADPPAPEPIEAQPQDIPLDVVYEDGELLVVNKPQGMVVHPAPGNPDGTLVNALLAHCGDGLSSMNGEIRPGIVHRIDKDTSGLLIVAKTDRAHRGLAEQIAVHSFERRYDAVLVGVPRDERGRVDAPIGRHPTRPQADGRHREKRQARPSRDYAVTERFVRLFASVECRLQTGRTHQIRVHMAYIGHPVLGDPVDRPDARRAARFGLSGQCLHAKYIEFTHPATGERLHFTAEPPAYFRRVTDALRGL